MLPGIHVSAAGGSVRALERAGLLSLHCAQIFTSSQTQWKGRTIDPEEAAGFRSARAIPVISHASYLINLASDREEVASKSGHALRGELLRMEQLGIRDLVMHPGSHMGRGDEEGIRLIAEGIAAALESVPGSTRILLENTAGMGTSVGCRFEQLAAIRERVGLPERTGICLDTAHAFAAGYDIRTPVAVEDMLAELEDKAGVGCLGAFHLNDSRTDLGSRVDRHAHAGQGSIGIRGLRHLVRRREFAGIPGIVETPGSDSDRKHDLDLLFGED
jgi:deoxyribonuclease-4